MPVYSLGDHSPIVPASAYVAPSATLIGKVTLGERASVWFGAVIRADNEPIRIGAASNVQECAVLHADPGFPLDIAAKVTVGHQAMLHGCTIGEGTLIGIQAVVMNGALIGHHCLVGAGAIVTERRHFPDRSLILGSPAKVVRELSDDEVARLAASAEDYAARGALYQMTLRQVG
jgi:carbonic anhydrase/acetyltransferase-like protein (isoleucine patch superfamily)